VSGLQKDKLFHPQNESRGRKKVRIEEILQVVQKTHTAQRNKEIGRPLKRA